MLKKQSDEFDKRVDKILVLGSAPYVIDWWKKHERFYKRNGFKIIPINNAVKVLKKDDVYRWCHSLNHNEFMKKHHPEITVLNDANYKTFVTIMDETNYDDLKCPPTTLIDCLYQILDVVDYNQIEVHVAGCDFNYDGGKTHFYKQNGTLDPLKGGRTCLVNNLERVNETYKFYECNLYNVGNQPNSLLPFERVQIPT
jgi:hypothetical protein